MTAPRRRGEASGLRGRLQLDKNGAPFLGANRIDLLEAIERCGSITQAAKAVGLSYKAAWDAVEAMNNQADAPLLLRAPGGRHGGGSRLTDYGRRVLRLVRTLEGEYQQMLALLNDRNAEFDEYQRLMRRLSLRTSARNQWVGRVLQVRRSGLHAEVELQLDTDTRLRAAVSASSLQRLGLAPGVEVSALVKAVAIRLRPVDSSPDGADSNRWLATISEVRGRGPRVEVTAVLPGGRSVTAIFDRSQGDAPLRKGTAICVDIEPSSVLLVAL